MKTLLSLFLLLSINVLAQEEPLPPDPYLPTPLPDSMMIYEIVEQEPEFPGGLKAMMKWLNDNLKYPEVALKDRVGARAYVRFVVEHDGSLSNIQLVHIRAEMYETEFKNEALRLVNSMPKWSPGVNQGKIVRTRYTIPVYFKVT